MMPITLADSGEELIIKRVGGSPDVRKHLENLGFTPGGSVTIVSRIGKNLIVKVKESRIAVDSELAQKIMV